MSSRIRTRRAYEEPGRDDGQRILVDGIWPRGVSKEELDAEWMKDLAPSSELRNWFGHDPDRWDEFRRRYFAELRRQPEAVDALRDRLANGRITLVYGARDEKHNQAIALKEFLERDADAG